MDLEIVYHIDDPHQFWAELEDIVSVSASSTLSTLDAALKSFVSFCATYHEQYLQTQVQLLHACTLLLDSELFQFHSDRLSSLLVADALANTDPHAQLVLHHVLLAYGRRHPSFLRAPKKWAELIHLLMDHILLVDLDCEDPASGAIGVVPIEARLRRLAVTILYEVCRVQKFDVAGLKVFNDPFIDHLFELVEATGNMPDETLNYCVIKLIVALNEQFMVSGLKQNRDAQQPSAENRVLQLLMRRLGSSKTFGQNLIFMLNRAGHTEEDRCMQLLVLKILYLLFTTPGTQEFFYTNDLRVLVDVFIRELGGDLDDESESLRHTYLRVLHPLLTNTQLRTAAYAYKRAQTLHTLDSLVAHAAIRDVSPTTRRLVERCLAADWAVKERERAGERERERERERDGASLGVVAALHPHPHPHPLRDLKFSKSADVLLPPPPSATTTTTMPPRPRKKAQSPLPLPLGADAARRNSSESALSLASVAGAAHHHRHPHSRQPSAAAAASARGNGNGTHGAPSPPSSASSAETRTATASSSDSPPQSVYSEPADARRPLLMRHRPAPAPPAKQQPRRRPPAVPSRATKAGGAVGGGGGAGAGGGGGTAAAAAAAIATMPPPRTTVSH